MYLYPRCLRTVCFVVCVCVLCMYICLLNIGRIIRWFTNKSFWMWNFEYESVSMMLFYMHSNTSFYRNIEPVCCKMITLRIVLLSFLWFKFFIYVILAPICSWDFWIIQNIWLNVVDYFLNYGWMGGWMDGWMDKYIIFC